MSAIERKAVAAGTAAPTGRHEPFVGAASPPRFLPHPTAYRGLKDAPRGRHGAVIGAAVPAATSPAPAPNHRTPQGVRP